MERPYKVYEFAFNALLFFWLMTLLPSESQQPDERLSLVWTMVYALAAAFAFGFFNDVVVGRWYPELNEGAQDRANRCAGRWRCSCMFSSASTSSRPSLF